MLNGLDLILYKNIYVTCVKSSGSAADPPSPIRASLPSIPWVPPSRTGTSGCGVAALPGTQRCPHPAPPWLSPTYRRSRVGLPLARVFWGKTGCFLPLQAVLWWYLLPQLVLALMVYQANRASAILTSLCQAGFCLGKQRLSPPPHPKLPLKSRGGYMAMLQPRSPCVVQQPKRERAAELKKVQ